jgi:hypothetical protein
MSTEYQTPKPAVPFNYYMVTTAVMEHSRGVAWTADLFIGVTKVGTIEQAGDGGADLVYISGAGNKALWKAAVSASFAGDEEAATFHLLVQEEESLSA